MSLLSSFTTFLWGYLALTLALYMLSLFTPRAGFPARVLASYVCLLAATGLGVLVSIVFTLTGHQQSAQWFAGRFFRWAMYLTTGVTFTIDDPSNVLGSVRPAVFIGNHQSELDVLMLGCMFPRFCSITAKSSLRRIPFLGWFMSLSGSIFIDRKNSRDAREAMQGAAAEIRSKRQSVYMFPEGTRSYAKEPMLLPFKKGAFHLAVQAGVPIVPCVVSNYSHILYVKNFAFNAGRIPIKGTSMPLCCSRALTRIVLDPIPTTGLTAADVDELTRTTRELILKELVALTERTKGRPMAMPAVGVNDKATVSGIDTTL